MHDGPPARRSRTPQWVLAIVAIVALSADFVSKLLVVAKLENTDHPPIQIVPHVLYFRHTRNTGAAFSFGTGYTLVLTVIAIAVVLFILRTARKLGSAAWAVALGLVLGGALGNLIDRLFREHGGVVDFLTFYDPYDPPFPIFNLADSSLVVGVCLLVLLELTGRRMDGSRVRDSKDDKA